MKKYPLVYNSSRKPQSSSLQMEGKTDSEQPICLNCALYIEFYWRALVCLTCKLAKWQQWKLKVNSSKFLVPSQEYAVHLENKDSKEKGF